MKEPQAKVLAAPGNRLIMSDQAGCAARNCLFTSPQGGLDMKVNTASEIEAAFYRGCDDLRQFKPYHQSSTLFTEIRRDTWAMKSAAGLSSVFSLPRVRMFT